MEFNPITAGEKAIEIRKLRKARNYKPRKSKLEPFRYEIVQMFKKGYSIEVIQLHLDTTHHCKAHRSTILRYLQSIGVTKNG